MPQNNQGVYWEDYICLDYPMPLPCTRFSTQQAVCAAACDSFGIQQDGWHPTEGANFQQDMTAMGGEKRAFCRRDDLS